MPHNCVPATLIEAGADPAGRPAVIRTTVGQRPRREAERTAERLATLCRAVFDLAEAGKDARAMNGESQLAGPEGDLVAQVVAACQAALGSALANPSEALSLAHGLDTALTTLKLVGSEVGKGERGTSAIVANADALTRNALGDVLRLARDPSKAMSALHAVARVAPEPQTTPPRPQATTVEGAAPVRPPASVRAGLPTFGEVSEDYIRMRTKADGENHADIKYLRLRRRTFLDVIGDRPVDQYYPSDLQDYVSNMQRWPANVTKRGNRGEQTTQEILKSNEDLSQKPLTRKTLQDGYVANSRTMIRYGMAKHRYRDPFGDVRIRWPTNLAPSTPREGIGPDVLNEVFRSGVASGVLDEAILPLFSVLTSRRLALLLYLRRSDIREKHGCIIAQTSGIVLEGGRWRRVPVKTHESMTFFVLNDFLSEIGLVDWMRKRDGWIFEEPHLHPDPSKLVSKSMNRLLRRCGAAGGNAEVFHCLRGDAITSMRENHVENRATRLQAGHELSTVHDLYGFKALSAEECRRIARLPLSTEIDWSVFRGLDFDALAAGRRSRGRPRRGG